MYVMFTQCTRKIFVCVLLLNELSNEDSVVQCYWAVLAGKVLQ